jgi:hypothetical protein
MERRRPATAVTKLKLRAPRSTGNLEHGAFHEEIQEVLKLKFQQNKKDF